MTPQQLADMALAAIDPTTVVTTDGTVQVAGRAAYELVLAPRDTASLVGSVRIADRRRAAHPAAGAGAAPRTRSTPAFEVGFTAGQLRRSGAGTFSSPRRPGPPSPTPALETDAGTDGPTHRPSTPARRGRRAGTAEPTIVGTGWTSVLVTSLPAPDSSTEPTDDQNSRPTETESGPAGGRPGTADLSAVLGSLPAVSGDWGSGRLLQSALFSVLITDDGGCWPAPSPRSRCTTAAAQ